MRSFILIFCSYFIQAWDRDFETTTVTTTGAPFEDDYEGTEFEQVHLSEFYSHF